MSFLPAWGRWWIKVRAFAPFRWWRHYQEGWLKKVAAEEAASPPDTEIGIGEW